MRVLEGRRGGGHGRSAMVRAITAASRDTPARVSAPGRLWAGIPATNKPGSPVIATVAAPVSDWQTGFAAEVDRLLAARDGHVHETLTHAVERLLITRALAHTGGRRIEAAHALGIGRNTITRKIHELGLDGGGEEGAHAPA